MEYRIRMCSNGDVYNTRQVLNHKSNIKYKEAYKKLTKDCGNIRG